MTRAIWAGLALAMTLGVTSVSQAQQPAQRDSARRGERQHAGQQVRRGEGFGFLLKGISLTDQQKTQLQQLHGKQGPQASNREGFDKIREQMKAARESGDTAALRRIRTDAQAQMKQRREARIASIRAILTPDQQKVFDSNVADAEKRFQEGGQRGEKRGGARGQFRT